MHVFEAQFNSNLSIWYLFCSLTLFATAYFCHGSHREGGGWSTWFPRGFSEFQVGFLSGNMENYAFPWNMKSLKIFIHISYHCCVPYMLHMTNQQNLNFCYCSFISDLFSIVCGLQFTCKIKPFTWSRLLTDRHPALQLCS